MERCRIWWPQQQLRPESDSDSGSSGLILVGWLFAREGSIDVVVAAALSQKGILRSFPTFDSFQTIIHSSNKRMPVRLQESTAFTILGDCCVHVPREFKVCCAKQNHQQLQAELVEKESFDTDQDSSVLSNGPLGCEDQDRSDINRKWGCNCTILDGFLDTCKESVIKKHNWVHFCCEFRKCLEKNLDQIPTLHHFYLGDQKFKIHLCHVILYDVPTARRNHFSLGEHALYRLKDPCKKPCWIYNLEQKPFHFYLDSIILALNCSHAARLPVVWETPISSLAHFFFVSVFEALIQLTQHCKGIFLASVSTIIYIFIQLFQKCVSRVIQYLMVQKVFSHSWKIIHFRSCQILYWPIFLQETPSSMVNVEYVHRAAIRKHDLWSNIVMDIVIGFMLGVLLLLNTETICSWIFTLVRYMTDNVLRSGCVWLMGVPAGFKLNTELAELLGMISVNAIQIYSTLWHVVGAFLRHIIRGLAFSGILLGFTVPASFFIDIIQLATLHVRMLQWFTSMIYSRQIQTVTSLWRLFRGRKWNPLRQRFDSYDYTVEQHVVGSLLFIPVLLLLPTTSIFYIFFSILSITIICLCIALETMISVIYSTPYAELILWLTSRQRFPAGLSLVSVPLSSVCTDKYEEILDEGCSASGYDKRGINNLTLPRSGHLVFELRCIYATLGQVIGPKYRNVFKGIGFSFCKQLAYGILSGTRIPSTLHLQLSPFPWMHIGIREYWLLCYRSLLSCAQK